MVGASENQSSSAMDSLGDFIEHKAYARVGLLGNPSDVYFGRTISFSLANFWATVRLNPSQHFVIQPHPTHDLVRFDSIHHLVNRLQNEGYYGGVRLLMAICKVFYKYCSDKKIELKGGNFTLSYDTNIPRQDFRKEYMDDLGHGMYTPMDISLLPPLYLIYAENPSDSGKVHSSVRKRWLDGDKFIISSMAEVANIALEARTALLEKDYTKLVGLMNRNFDLRRRMFGDEALGSLNIQMVEVARSVGAASKFTGSGGAVVAFCPDGPSQAKLLEDACKMAGFIFQPAEVVPSLLNEEDLKTLSSK
ncbi:glucuronokinase 1-like isoform X3 [Tasmannia lanceolata]|uniref:glucuronokinase 1-like isoform X3 n=1 Tax=Tasmannia lanceolata TaxID=3420 RepID=UPI004063FA7E